MAKPAKGWIRLPRGQHWCSLNSLSSIFLGLRTLNNVNCQSTATTLQTWERRPACLKVVTQLEVCDQTVFLQSDSKLPLRPLARSPIVDGEHACEKAKVCGCLVAGGLRNDRHSEVLADDFRDLDNWNSDRKSVV